MAETIEGKLDASGMKFGIVVSRFNDFICQRLLEGAVDALVRHGADDKNIKVYRTPGSFEIPVVARKLATKGGVDAIICLGAVIRGGTPHFDFVAAEVSKGIAAVAMEASLPVTFGVITADTLEQAIDRAGAKSGNKGFEAAMAAIEMADLFKKLS